jgi:hypothetical protein
MPSSSPGLSATSTPPPEPAVRTRWGLGGALILPLIIQTILLDPSGAVWTDGHPT